MYIALGIDPKCATISEYCLRIQEVFKIKLKTKVANLSQEKDTVLRV